MDIATFSNTVEKNFVTSELIISQLSPKKIPQAKAFKNFLDYTLIRNKESDFWQRNIEQLADELYAFWFFLQKKPQPTLIKIFNPSQADDGFDSPFTCIYISQMDAPFIVDSIQMALNELKLETHLLLSIGGLNVLRDGAGELREVAIEDTDEPGWTSEDPIYIQINKQFDKHDFKKLTDYFEKVLQELHQAYADASLMREKCQWIIDELQAHKRHIPSDETREAITFLKWLIDDHFIFLGYREYHLNTTTPEPQIELISGSGFGLLRDESHAVKVRRISSLPAEAQRIANSKQILAVSKTNTKSRIHRPSYTDYIGIKHYNEAGELIGEHRFIGLFPHSAYNESVKNIPYLRHKANAVMLLAKASPSGHIGKTILNILENFPRDDMFQMAPEELYHMVEVILRVHDRPMIRLLARKDAYHRFYSCLIFIPKEKISANLHQRFSKILLDELHGYEISMRVLLSDSIQGRLHYVVRIPNEARDLAEPDFAALEKKLIDTSKTWLEKLKDQLTHHYGEAEAVTIFKRYQHAFSMSYQEDYAPDEVLYDIANIEQISTEHPIASKLFKLPTDSDGWLSLKLYQLNQLTTLSEIIPVLENMGLEVIEENPYECKLSNKTVWVCLYRLKIRHIENANLEVIRPLFDDLFNALWDRKVENDRLNALVLKSELPWHLVAVLRAYCCYYKQVEIYSQAYLEEVLVNQFQISKQLMQLFALRFDPKENHDAEVIALKTEIQKALSKVTNLDEDKILRNFLALIDATLRTNYYQCDVNGLRKSYISCKFQSNKVPNLPLPHPCFEIFVYSPRFEAIHLRGAKVARGGIRWSDRREDFRTEVLGLMKAQQVKNTVIVPGGSKGGFVLKATTSQMNREELQQEAITCYQNFMRGLLDLTDNIVDGSIVHPCHVRRFDEEDPYLVVAADKGTATFSDYANAVAAEYLFWLGDAFASGGSNGYDHKKIGITAKGAWISVEAHFKTQGIDPEQQEFTAIGIGDMSGDVFGNGMLRSRKTKLIAAFNHLHIFIDPNPTHTEASFEERLRLFNLPGSTWQDYNATLISEGGGVFERKAKSITLTPQIKQVLDISEDHIEPAKLIQAILKAKVDLFFNGGIGTYVKASSERNQDVGDKTNDQVRVDANQLRCRIVGEGGNLGFTQLARVEFAQKGGLIFTDFIDNSAGVDLSDHEVNIKILLNQALHDNQLDLSQRNALLRSMTNDVAILVLADNKDQTETLSFAISQAINELEVYARCIQNFQQQGQLDPQVEFLPTERGIEERQKTGKGLTAPEIAVVMAYVKMNIKSAILKSDIPDDPYFQPLLEKEFPQVLGQNYRHFMTQHRLRREIISTQLTNQLLNETGILFTHRLQEETGASTPMIIKAYAVVREIFKIPHIIAQIRSLDFKVSHSIQIHMLHRLSRFVRRATRWLLRHIDRQTPIETTIKNWHLIPEMLPTLPEFLCGEAKIKFTQLYDSYINANVPKDVAQQLATIRGCYALLDINAISLTLKQNCQLVSEMYFTVGEELGLDWLREVITAQAVTNHWEALAHSSLRDQLDRLQAALVLQVLHNKEKDKVSDYIKRWRETHHSTLRKWHNILNQLQHATKFDYIMYSVALNVLDTVVQEVKM